MTHEARAPEGRAAPGQPWTIAAHVTFAFAVVAPALVFFFVAQHLPFVGAPLAVAMRGDSPLASGTLALVALIGAAGLATRALGPRRSPAFVVATGGAVLLGIVMIIVTFSASDTAELGITPPAAGIVPLVAPIAPLAVAVAIASSARGLWLSRYNRRDAMMLAILASLMLFAAAELGPFGAVRTVSQTASHTTR
jgi:hypothetical protein